MELCSWRIERCGVLVLTACTGTEVWGGACRSGSVYEVSSFDTGTMHVSTMLSSSRTVDTLHTLFRIDSFDKAVVNQAADESSTPGHYYLC